MSAHMCFPDDGGPMCSEPGATEVVTDESDVTCQKCVRIMRIMRLRQDAATRGTADEPDADVVDLGRYRASHARKLKDRSPSR